MIIRLSSLGDVLLTTPVISALHQKYPDSQIDFLVKPQFVDAVKTNPILNHIHEFDKSKNYDVLIKSLQKNKYDLVIDLQNNFRSRKICSKLSAKVYRFKKPTLKKFLFVNFKWNLYKKVKSIPQMYFESIPELEFTFQKPSLFVPEEVISSIKPGKYIGFAPGSKHFTKMWPIEYFNELGKLVSAKGYTILLFGGSDDKEICHNLKQEIPGAIDLSTENDLIQIARDMKQCKLIVCNDSGLMHTAVSVDVPVIAIFGSTVKEFGFAPYSENSLVIENEELKCRPCSHIGKDKCPKSHFKCLLELTPELVYNKIEKFISL